MSRRLQSKRSRFYAQQRRARIVERITKANREKDGFVGVVLGLRIGSTVLGAGAIFIR